MTFSAVAFAQQPSRLSPRSRMPMAPAGAVLPAYITTDGSEACLSRLDSLGVKITICLDGVATARIPSSKLAEVASTQGVVYVQTASAVEPMLDLAKPEAGADKVAAGTGLSQPYTGSGVVVGVVDAGFDYGHATFYDAAGNLRIKRVWEQASTPSSPYVSPEKYGYGIELSTPAQIEAAGGDITNNSHGTHVACIAAGSDSFMDGAYRGVAPDADIVLVSMGETSRDNVNLTNALSYIFDYADAVGKPCVVNLSLGNHAGPHDGTSTFDRLADQMQGPGRLIVGAAGNHRAYKFHLSRVFAGADDQPLRTFADFYTPPSAYNKGGDIEIWGEAGMEFEVVLSAYNLFSKEEVESVTVYPSDEPVTSVSLGRNLTGTLSVASEVSPLNGKPHVMISSELTGMRNNYALALSVVPKSAGQIDIWADNSQLGLTDNGIVGYSRPESESTICEIGGTASRILTVGAYTTRNEYTLYGSTTTSTLNEPLGEISSFSGNGPTADGRLKPEVSAPGCFIISAVSSNDASGTLILAQAHADDNRSNLYGYMQGTSMSAPFVTGVVATWLQAHPTLTPEELKGVVARTARQDSHTGTIGEAGDYSWGYGKIDAYGGLCECLELEASGIYNGSTVAESMVVREGGAIRVMLPVGAARAVAEIFAVNGTLVVRHTISAANSAIDIASLSSGVYVLKLSAGGSVKTIKFAK